MERHDILERHDMDIETMKKKWSKREAKLLSADRRHESAVLLPLIEEDGVWKVLFEVRARDIIQGGDICFPGGALEAGEDFLEAALREAEEELLIDRSQIEVIGPLDYMDTIGHVVVKPFLAVIKDYANTFSRDEVERVIKIPLSFFLDHEPDRYVNVTKQVMAEDFPYDRIVGGRDYRWRTSRHEVLFYPEYEGDTVWGITAKLLDGFVRLYKC